MQVFFRIDPDAVVWGLAYKDRNAILKKAQLLQTFTLFKRCLRQLHKAVESLRFAVGA